MCKWDSRVRRLCGNLKIEWNEKWMMEHGMKQIAKIKIYKYKFNFLPQIYLGWKRWMRTRSRGGKEGMMLAKNGCIGISERSRCCKLTSKCSPRAFVKRRERIWKNELAWSFFNLLKAPWSEARSFCKTVSRCSWSAWWLDGTSEKLYIIKVKVDLKFLFFFIF